MEFLQPLEILLLVGFLLVNLLRRCPLLGGRTLSAVKHIICLLHGSNLRDLKVTLVDSMDARVHLCVLHKVLVPLQKELACLLVQGRFWVGHNQQALDRLQTNKKGTRTYQPVVSGTSSSEDRKRKKERGVQVQSTDQQNVLDPQVLLPVLLQGADTNVTIAGHIRVENLGEEEPCTGRKSVKRKVQCNGVCKERDKPFGGEFGKSDGSTSLMRKTPPSYGVPSARSNFVRGEKMKPLEKTVRKREDGKSNLVREWRPQCQ